MKRLVIGICAIFLVLTFAYLTTDNSPVVAEPAAPAADGKPIPLFNSATKLEPATIEDTPTALITRVADRGRDRHAREGMFKVYEHYIGFYFEFRTSTIEIVDTVAKGGDSVTLQHDLAGALARAEFTRLLRRQRYRGAIYGQYDCQTGRSTALHPDLQIQHQ